MRPLRTAVLVLAAVCAHATSLIVAPTTTLTAESSNNTSTASSWTTSANGNLGASNISKVDHRTLLYPGSTTPIYSHLLLWFGPPNHIQVGYRSDDYSQVKRQVDDHISRGLAGAIIDWYGTSHTVDTTAAFYLMQYAESLPGYPFKFAMMEDKGALLACSHTAGCDLNAQLVSDLSYVVNTFASSPAYITLNGRPVILFFGVEDYPIDLNYVKSAVPGNPLFIFENAGAFTRTASDGGFAWVQINPVDTYDWQQGYLDYFYSYANHSPGQHAFGAAYKGFNDSLASWSGNRIMSQQCGQVWLNTWSEVARYHSSSNQLESMEIVTWNDYEEGTAIEPGVDNCLSVSASVSGSALSWTVSGNENTLDHYTAFISSDGENLMSLADIAPGIHSLDLTQYGIGPGHYLFYVKAVGKPSIVNHMSGAADLTVGQPPAVVLNISPLSGIAPVVVTAAADSDSGVSTLLSFGEGPSVRASNASHTYSIPGTYTVSATVTDVYGLSSTATQTVTVNPNQPPMAALSVNSGSGLAGSTISVSTAGSSDPDDAIAASIIDFGDGTVVKGFDATHAYVAGGTYTVTATVTDTRGAQSATSSTVTIADFGLNITSQNRRVTATQQARFVVAVAPQPQLNDSVSLGCSGLPAGYACTFSPAVLTPGSNLASSTLAVSASTSSARLVRPLPCLSLWCGVSGLFVLGAGPALRRSIRRAILGCMLLTLLGLVSCGGSGGGSGSSSAPPGTSVSFTVTATAGTLQHSVQTNLILP